MAERVLLRRIRLLLALFMAGLVVSGATAIPLPWELALVTHSLTPPGDTPLARWLLTVRAALDAQGRDSPFLAYGTDWLAFGHFVIAVAFVGPWRDPVRNRWVLTFGLIACALVVPYALVFGALRGIPFVWRLIDCSFGVVGFVPLWLCDHDARRLEQMALAGAGTSREAARA